MSKLELLQKIKFGQRIAEEETESLINYFVETENWRQLFSGEIDVIYGPKGAGKSALYTILEKYGEDLFDKNIILTTAENPRGNTVFEGLTVSPPTGETEFVRLWKLYFLVITITIFNDWKVKNSHLKKLNDHLEEAKLIPRQQGLKAILRACREYLSKLESISPNVEIDNVTGNISAGLKVAFHQPSDKEYEAGMVSIDELYELLEAGLKESKFNLWIAVDRLDVAFTENLELETNALKALFKTYRDLSNLQHLKIKIFLRDDIWKRITEEGFREASHITKTLTISWSKESLLNLITRRILSNPEIIDYYKIDVEEIMSDYVKQVELFYTLFPEQIDIGDKKPKTLDWILTRLRDGKGIIAPRELVHLFNEARQEQVKKIQLGQNDLEKENIIGRQAFKNALNEVSKVRLQQTIYPEYPSLKEYIEKLEGEKTEQTVHNLCKIWGLNIDESLKIIKKLIDIGFMELKGEKSNHRYWIPFIYRGELNMSQGKSE